MFFVNILKGNYFRYMSETTLWSRRLRCSCVANDDYFGFRVTTLATLSFHSAVTDARALVTTASPSLLLHLLFLYWAGGKS